MNGAQAMVGTLEACGVTVCFANPGTSEMHAVFALDDVEQLNAVLCLDEGVVTGAADGYARLAGRPAATLLHLGPGLGNGWANLHNARRARSPVVNVVGDHATYHRRHDAPLESDLDALAHAVSRWVRRPSRAHDVGPDTAEAVAAASAAPGGVATLILPADVGWTDGGAVAAPVRVAPRGAAADEVVATAAAALATGEPAALLLGGTGLLEPGLRAASRIAAATGARVFTQTHVARMQRGVGRPSFPALGYFAEQADEQLAGIAHLVCVDCPSPVAFFAYPGRPSSLVPAGAAVHHLGDLGQDIVAALEALADRVAPGATPTLVEPLPRQAFDADAPLDAGAIGRAVGATLPPDAVVIDEAITSRIALAAGTVAAAPHDWLALTGGAIGEGLPLATGAAFAAPHRRVVALQADGSAMYTIQALWTQARHRLGVTNVILNNRAYAILQIEMQRIVGRTPGPRAAPLLDLAGPDLDFVALAAGMGVPGEAVETVGQLVAALARANAASGPYLIDALMT